MEAIPFATPAWIHAFFQLAQADAELAASLKTFRGPMTLVMGAQAGTLEEDLVVWLDAGFGQVRACEQIAHSQAKERRFVIRAPYAVWERIARERRGLFKALLTGKLRVEGPKTELLRHARTAGILGRLLSQVPTRFP